VVRAIARADATVVNHVIQAYGAVRGRVHRTDRLARRVLAMHARHRLEEWPDWIYFVAFVISIDANPVHLAAARHLFFADDRNIVLSLTSHRASIATYAT